MSLIYCNKFCLLSSLCPQIYGRLVCILIIVLSGVIAQESGDDWKDKGDTFIRSSYFRFVELAGARAVPIRSVTATLCYIHVGVHVQSCRYSAKVHTYQTCNQAYCISLSFE